MPVDEREYMTRPFENVADEGVVAINVREAESLLHFACPTQAANGKWYRTTIAVSNVPVAELYNVLSNANFISQRLRELVKPLGEHEFARAIINQADAIDRLRELLKQRDCTGGRPIVFDGQNVHLARNSS